MKIKHFFYIYTEMKKEITKTNLRKNKRKSFIKKFV